MVVSRRCAHSPTLAYSRKPLRVSNRRPVFICTDLESLLLRAEATTGRCYVLTFSAKHDVTLADMTPQEILPVVNVWTDIYASHVSPSSPLGAAAAAVRERLAVSAENKVTAPPHQLRYMTIFENKGAAMGCSNPHPHCQVWTTSSMPEEPGKELAQMSKYRSEQGGRHILGDYVKLELEKQERVLWQNDGFLVVCPWWALWPFEVLVIAKRHVRALVDLTDDERLQFAEAIQEVTRRYDNLFETNFPYSTFAVLWQLLPSYPSFRHCSCSQVLTSPKALGSTRHPLTAARRRPRAAGSTCISIRPCSAPRLSRSSLLDTNSWPSHNVI